MRRAWIRSILFNIAFIAVTGVLCVAYIPTLLLPREMFGGFVRFWIYTVTFLEYAIMGITYEVRGKEFLPKDGPYIVAAKHQSAYETIKLRILFKDPAIILKKELLSIPMWGWYLKKSGVIAIDRGTPERALKSIEEGAIRIVQDGRPIVIFPQGTRVKPETNVSEKPYKPGVARVQQSTDLPIIPMALNSGLFWPKGSWLKTPGKVVFEFFESIQPGMERKALMNQLEEKIESESNRLMNEARAKALEDKSGIKNTVIAVVLCALLFAGYSYLWQQAAKKVITVYAAFLTDVAEVQRIHAEPVLSGFPGRITLSVANESITSQQGSVDVQNLVMRGWPVPFTPVHIKSGPITVKSFKWSNPLLFDSFEAWARYSGHTLKISNSQLIEGDFQADAAGTIDLSQEPFPKFDMTVIMKNFAPFIGHLAQLNILKSNQALFISAGLTMLSQNGQVSVPITQDGNTLYAGPLPIASLPDAKHPATDIQSSP